MKTNPPNRYPVRPNQPKHRGAALIFTVSMLSLLIVMTVAFISLARTESRSADGFAQGQSVRRLADSVNHLLMAQIRSATEGFPKSEAGSYDTTSPLTWSSQPGMIHTFRNTGEPDRVFKLYSSEQMVQSVSSTVPLNESAALEGWDTKPDVFTDLNSPVMVLEQDGSLTAHSPIIEVNDLIEGPNGTGLTYASNIDGFHIDPPKTFRSGEEISPTNNPAPMPVRWLYLLKDGQITAPQNGEGIARFPAASLPTPTKENPIVARIAFWTDDECAKVNVNTASEGVYWDIPRMWSEQDIGVYSGGSSLTTPGLAYGQPAQKEFQRYSGHPATTNLSAVLGSIIPRPTTITDRTARAFNSYYSLTPRTNAGGSEAGTKKVSQVMEIKNERLYPSVGDFLFSKDFSGSSRTLNPRITPEIVRRGEFFLSAHSVAPETTLFNTPRIAIWPVWQNARQRTAYDKLAAFCSTIGKNNFYLTRQNPRSPTADMQGRNTELYQWLQRLTSTKIPGYGGDFASKFQADRDQLLTQIFDYIRATNPQDRSTGAIPFTPIYNSVNAATVGAGEIIPLRVGDTQGFGRYYAISSPGLYFTAETKTIPADPSDPSKPKDIVQTEMTARFVAEFFAPAHGIACLRPKTKWRVTGLDQFKVTIGNKEESLNLPSSGTNLIEQGDLDHWGGRGIGGTTSLLTTMRTNGSRGKKTYQISGGDSIPENYPFFSAPAVVLPTGTTEKNFQFKGGKVKLEILTSDTNEVIQTSEFEFPDGVFKLPTPSTPIGVRDAWWPNEFFSDKDTLVSLEIAGIQGNANTPEADSTAGDKRMVAGLINVPARYFRPHRDYSKEGVQFAHTFTLNSGPNRIPGNLSGKLVDAPSYLNGIYNRNPDVPARAGNRVTRSDGTPGEWDTGMGDQPDGAYINKPNDADTAYESSRAPYILGRNQGFAAATNEFFSPNLQVPSSLMFGSLPTGVKRFRPWETLLFHARPEDPKHPGRTNPPDHLIADLFWMPVIEPYAISTPFATAGKINLNHQIQPFGYIHRSTGLHAVLKGGKFLALAPADAGGYKPLDPGTTRPFLPDRRLEIDPAATINGFTERYLEKGVFRSASEICEMNLVPEGRTHKQMSRFWTSFGLTGDNVRERPYVDIYPKLTTRSNSFTVHYKVQVLKKARSTEADSWDPAKDQIVGEQRGSTLIERFIDPADPRIPDFATLEPNSPAAAIDQYYRFRILSSRTFQPTAVR